jgi:hypothetical protein
MIGNKGEKWPFLKGREEQGRRGGIKIKTERRRMMRKDMYIAKGRVQRKMRDNKYQERCLRRKKSMK